MSRVCRNTSRLSGASFIIFVVIFLMGKTEDSVLNVIKSVTEATKRFTKKWNNTKFG